MLSHEEVLLYKMLQGFFGLEHVIPQMRFVAVCQSAEIRVVEKHEEMAKRHRCLFTIVDHADKPKLVFELGDSDSNVIDVNAMQDKSLARDILEKAGIKHVAISRHEVDELREPGTPYTFTDYLRDKLEL